MIDKEKFDPLKMAMGHSSLTKKILDHYLPSDREKNKQAMNGIGLSAREFHERYFDQVDRRLKRMDEKKREVLVTHSPDFRLVTWKKRNFSFTDRQAQIIKFMWEQRKKGKREISKEEILEEIGETERFKELDIKELFKKSSAWKYFIKPVTRRKGRYCLVIPIAKSK
jgi:hypothetical protein